MSTSPNSNPADLPEIDLTLEADPTQNTHHTKLMQVTLQGNGEFSLALNQDYIDAQNEEEAKKVASNILQVAAMSMLQESEAIKNNPETKDVDLSANPGSLYDEVIFDAGIYVQNGELMHVHPSFGMIAPVEKVWEGYRRISDTLLSLANEFHPLDQELLSEAEQVNRDLRSPQGDSQDGDEKPQPPAPTGLSGRF